ncbi:HD domain-containing protein [Breznakiella homolactica]|uniref:HD domain-containing protein n=2 Tax=Breznakiella homolactica TaxID=2798577 RepID=A0A7T8BCD9_9SPIR|nr:HD domain-containing protein [Breznakiella homolactica]
MMEYEKGCPQRIQHFLKVLSFSEQIGRMENLDEETFCILKTAAVVHDIGIRVSLEKHGSGAGNYQQIEGPPIAQPMLEALGYEKDVTDRVCYLIAHHHTYGNIDGPDYQILVEADFLVNIFENEMPPEAVKKVRQNIFRTESGKQIFDCLYP